MSEAVDLIQVLSDEEISEIEAEVAHLPDRQSAAIDAMMIVQRGCSRCRRRRSTASPPSTT